MSDDDDMEFNRCKGYVDLIRIIKMDVVYSYIFVCRCHDIGSMRVGARVRRASDVLRWTHEVRRIQYFYLFRGHSE